MGDPTQLQIPPEAYAAIGALLVANLPSLIKFIRDFFKKDASIEMQFQVISMKLDQISKDVSRLESTQEKTIKDVNEAFRQIRETRG